MSSEKPAHQTLSIVQFIISGLVVLGLWGLAFILLVQDISNIILSDKVDSSQTPPYLFSILLVGLSILYLPALWSSFSRILGKGGKQIVPFRITRFWILVLAAWGLILYAGQQLDAASPISNILFPIIHFLAVILPIGWILLIILRAGTFGSIQRFSGLFLAGSLGGTGISLVFEVLVGVIVILVAGLVLIANPSLQTQFSKLWTEFSLSAPDSIAVENALLLLVQRPWALAVIFGLGCIVMPMIEELCKPIGMWFLGRHHFSSKDGFIAGALSGAGFAVIESMFNASALMSNQDWMIVLFSRFGTGLMHILSSGLVGYGLVFAWKEHKWLKGISLYLLAVAVHGLWNFSAFFLAYLQIAPETALGGSVKVLTDVMPTVTTILAVLYLLIIFIISKPTPPFNNRPPAETAGGNFML